MCDPQRGRGRYLSTQGSGSRLLGHRWACLGLPRSVVCTNTSRQASHGLPDIRYLVPPRCSCGSLGLSIINPWSLLCTTMSITMCCSQNAFAETSASGHASLGLNFLQRTFRTGRLGENNYLTAILIRNGNVLWAFKIKQKSHILK